MNNVNAVSNVSASNYPVYTEAQAVEQPEIDFSEILADAMRDGAMQTAVTAGGGLMGMPGGFLPVHNHGVEEAIIAAASSGQLDDAQIALFMLMMMMQTGQGGDSSGMLMQMMASMLMQMQGDDAGTLRRNAMAADFEPYVKDRVDAAVFNFRAPNVTGPTRAILPVEHWRATTPVVTSSVGNRSPELYRAVINQFDVENAERYRPFRNGFTYCNIYVWDVTRAMGAEVPLYTDPATGDRREYPDTRGARSMGAIAMCNWLETHGARYGWREVDAEGAQMHANKGKPAVTSAGSLGHVQMVIPSRDGGFDPVRGVTIAQAGRVVTNFMHISGIYGGNALNNSVRYWVHD